MNGLHEEIEKLNNAKYQKEQEAAAQ